MTDVARGQLYIGEQIDAATHDRQGTAVLLQASDFTTHGVIVGMTGSGKTGLGLVLVEEALLSGVPALIIDPKGDLTNLALTFPELRPADFRPWINEADATRAGATPDAFAEQEATRWREGLASWGVDPARIAALRGTADITIYTPGSTSGVPLNLVGSLQAPANADAETIGDEVEGFVSGLLGLVDVDADPLSSREHILLSNIVAASWTAGRDLDLATLVGQVQQPPVRKLGVFEVDTFFPPKDRTELALRLNGLLASPSFAAWTQGVPFDIDRLLDSPDGKPAAAIVTIAHLSDPERQFVTSLLLGKLVTWMRRQSGTTDLRALVYMDEVAGYAPPTAEPPSKKPILTLLKQARAFGVGLVLSTQNPVDLDYKAISNAGTWMIGRLQTERDKARLLEGMTAASGSIDIDAVGDTISGLGKREFVLKRAGVDQPTVFTTRWAMAYLRGPLTREQIASLTEPVGSAPAADAGNCRGAASPSWSGDGAERRAGDARCIPRRTKGGGQRARPVARPCRAVGRTRRCCLRRHPARSGRRRAREPVVRRRPGRPPGGNRVGSSVVPTSRDARSLRRGGCRLRRAEPHDHTSPRCALRPHGGADPHQDLLDVAAAQPRRSRRPHSHDGRTRETRSSSSTAGRARLPTRSRSDAPRRQTPSPT